MPHKYLLNKKKLLLLAVGLGLVLIITQLVGCKSPVKNNKETYTAKNDSEKIAEYKQLSVIDTGQVYFHVILTKNNQPFKNYEGDYPVATKLDSSIAIQLFASKHILDITDMLDMTVYAKEKSMGNFPVNINPEKGKAIMNMTTVKNEEVGSSILLDKGNMAITKYTDSLISGNFHASGMDADSNKISLSGLFLNVKYN